MTTTTPRARPRAGRLELLAQLVLGVPLARPLRCPRCRWVHYRARLATLELLAAGHTVRCTWCAQPMTQGPAK